jgi:integrase/recombinase XerD
MIDSLFAWKRIQSKQREAPLLKERERYLSALLNQGVCKARVRTIACLLLHITRLLKLSDHLRAVTRIEIQDAGQRWLTDTEGHTTRGPGTSSLYTFTHTAENWFRFCNSMSYPPIPVRPFDANLSQFIQYLKSERQFTPSSIVHYKSRVSLFLRWVAERRESFSTISLVDIDEFLAAKRNGGCKLQTLAAECGSLRAFFSFCELQGWSDPAIARGIRRPRQPRYDVRSRGPRWKEVRRLIASNSGPTPGELRARAIILLCSIYATRSIEVANLKLSDFDWMNETFTLRRAKGGRVQQFPIQFEVGEAILDYLQRGRPVCSCRSLFVSLQTPYRPINSGNVWEVVAPRIMKLGIDSERKGPHSLRHACATELLRRGSSLRDIADFLGHRNMSSVCIYAKSDAGALKAVAAFSLAGVK